MCFFFSFAFDMLKATHIAHRTHSMHKSNVYMKIFHAEFVWISEKWLPLMYSHLALWFDRLEAFFLEWKLLNHECSSIIFHLSVCPLMVFSIKFRQNDCNRIVISHRCSDLYAIFHRNTCSRFRACWQVILIRLKANVIYWALLEHFLVVIYQLHGLHHSNCWNSMPTVRLFLPLGAQQ